MMNRELAQTIVNQYVGSGLRLRTMRPLSGGMVNAVEEWTTDGTPAAIVAKWTTAPNATGFFTEHRTLAWYHEHTEFPVPESYACFSGELGFEGTVLLMERVPGRHLGEARMTDAGARQIEIDLARHLTRLHSHTRDTYGSALGGPTTNRYLDLFRPALQREFDAVSCLLSPRERRVVEDTLNTLEQWLPDQGQPILVHGDLWATNIMVDDRDAARPRVSAFIDMGANYCDVEQELAYLLIFHTVGETFFREYTRTFPLREGFNRRCRIYWLNTWLLHVRMFGVQYLPPTQRTIREIERMR